MTPTVSEPMLIDPAMFRWIACRIAGLEAALSRVPACNADRIDYWVRDAEIRYDAALAEQDRAAAADFRAVMSTMPFPVPALDTDAPPDAPGKDSAP